MFYFGETPWHRLGTRLSHPATAAEAMEQAGLNFTVQKKPLRAMLNKRSYVDVIDHFAIIRMDTGDCLGVVGSRYEPIQNRDCFSFFDPLVDRSESIYHTAGVIGKGEKIWLLAKLPDYIRIGPKKDPVEKYLLLYNSHDGSSHIRVKLTPIRVVCNNTLSSALRGADDEVRVKHTASAPEKLEEAHKILGLTNSLFQELDFIFNRMALRKVTDKEMLNYVKTLVPDNPEADTNTRTENIRNKILYLHDSREDSKMHRGTAFGLYNAVTEMVDHFVTTEDPNKALKSVWFGSGERLKLKAFSLAEDLIKN
jgi:phage/plasmid-like protein (TIGR03299 family)